MFRGITLLALPGYRATLCYRMLFPRSEALVWNGVGLSNPANPTGPLQKAIVGLFFFW